MRGTHTDPSYRAITVVALIQAGVIVGGTLFVAVMLKLGGYQGGAFSDSHFNPRALFVRNSGCWLLLIPVSWAALGVFAAQRTVRSWVPLVMVAVGIAGILFGIFFYLTVGLDPGII